MWHNAMEMRGLQNAQNTVGDIYRGIQSFRAIQMPIQLGMPLFHPFHVYTIHVAEGLANAVYDGMKAKSLQDGAQMVLKDLGMSARAGFGHEGLNPLRLS